MAEPDIIDDLAELAARVLKKNGVLGKKADQWGRDIAEACRDDWGGLVLYFPKGVRYSQAKRDQRIYEDSYNQTVEQLANKYRLCVQTIYKIIERERNARQADLFNT